MPQKPIPPAYKQRPVAIKAWPTDTSRRLSSAKAERAEVHLGDETNCARMMYAGGPKRWWARRLRFAYRPVVKGCR